MYILEENVFLHISGWSYDKPFVLLKNATISKPSLNVFLVN